MSIKIDQNKCIGCGNCSRVCPEGIDMINGKAAIKNADAECLQEASKVCPINIIEFTKDEDKKQGLKKENEKIGLEFFENRNGSGLGRGQGGQGRGLGFGRNQGNRQRRGMGIRRGRR